MKRTVTLALILALALFVTGCQRKVQVVSGVRVTCTYGEVISDTVTTMTVPARDAGNYRVVNEIRLCDRHARMEDAYARAQRALAARDFRAAEKDLASIVAVDPTYRQAAAQLDAIKKGKKPKPDKTQYETGSSGSANPGAGPSPAELTRWIPASLAGWRALKESADPLSASREYLPEQSASVRRAVVYVEQFRSAAEAKTAIDRQVKASYAEDAKNLTVSGHKAYFGTDGHEFAVLAFTDGPVMVAVEMTAYTGSPKELRDALSDFVKLLP
jgi:hypothetical protein